MSDEPKLRLDPNGLLNKWGFNDGAEPEELLDYCDQHDLPYPDGWREREMLHALVVKHLLPVLDQRVELVCVETSHNPVRALTVDGMDVTDQWRGEQRTRLTPDCIEIPMGDVVKMFHPDHPKESS